MDNALRLYTAPVPSAAQKIVQDMKFYAFIHFTVNAFTDREWGDGRESESVFNPSALDTDAWCAAVRSAGMKGVILTAKHHDGFCLWQTKTTEHSVKNSPYKNGQGDIVRELSESCKKYGLRFGVYLSPWDRNSEYYGTDKYNDFYIAQLTELLSDYGEIFMLWLDGACDAAGDGKPLQIYDFPRIWETARRLQPNICISGCAPDIRWVGNEAGNARESEWNVVPRFRFEMQNFEKSCTDNYAENYNNRCKDILLADLGSRERLSGFDEFIWYPAEVDVSIRDGWFWHEAENDTVKSLDRLMEIYYKAVGGNSLLLLNIPPDNRGLFHENDVKRLKEMGREIEKMNSLMIENAEIGGFVSSERGYELKISFPETEIDRLRLEENCDFSQRIERFEIYAEKNGGEKLLYSGTVVGFGKIAIFEPILCSELRLVVRESRLAPQLSVCEVYKSGAYRINRN